MSANNVFAHPQAYASQNELEKYNWFPAWQQLWREHDQTALYSLHQQLAELEWGGQAFELGRLIAGYEDQRGWFQQAEKRYRELLTHLENNPTGPEEAGVRLARQATLLCDLAEFYHRWFETGCDVSNHRGRC
jgi:hypothetical protein